MAMGPWRLYFDYLFNESKKLIDLSSDVLKVALFDAASIAINQAVVGASYTAFNGDGHEVANGNGYTTGGVTVTGSWTGGGASATSTFDTADASWTGSGAGFTARVAVLYSDSSAGKLAIAFSLLDATPADVTVAPGNTLTIHVSGVFVASQA